MSDVENLHELYSTAGILLVDAQGHDIISAKIASTIHDTFHAFLLSEIDHHGKTTPGFFERMNLRMAQSVTPRNVLQKKEMEDARETATMLYGEVQPSGHFRFVNFGHPPPLLFSTKCKTFVRMDRSRMVQFPPLGLEVAEDYPDRSRYYSLQFREKRTMASDITDLELIRSGDMLLLYTDGVYDGSDERDRQQLEALLSHACTLSAKAICAEVLKFAQAKDELLRKAGEADRIDDKTVFLIRRT